MSPGSDQTGSDSEFAGLFDRGRLPPGRLRLGRRRDRRDAGDVRTGGGLIENPPRAIAEGLVARFDWNAWELPPVFAWMQQVGGVSDQELRRTFNCGIGLMLIVDPRDLAEVLEGLVRADEDAFVIGELAKA